MAHDFADVYTEHLESLWRFVRSRIPDVHAAEDVTAEVFSRAWRSWGRFDPERGSVRGWLFGIAHHVVADWWRHAPSEVLMAERPEPGTHDHDPVRVPLRRETTARVSVAVAHLSERDRDALALRFGGQLPMADLARVLGISVSGAKMTVSRALERLRDVVAADDVSVEAHDLSPTLEALLADAKDRVVATAGDPTLLELVAHLSVIHTHEVPDQLPERIAACVGCEEYRHAARAGDTHRGRPRPQRWNAPAVVTPLWFVLGIACLTCTLPVIWPTLSALGLTTASFTGHYVGLFAAPLVFWIVRRQSARHRDRLPVRLAATGMVLLAVHLVMHVTGFDGPLYRVWSVADWAGSWLLFAGVVANWRALEHWLRRQRRQLAERVSTRPRSDAVASGA